MLTVTGICRCGNPVLVKQEFIANQLLEIERNRHKGINDETGEVLAKNEEGNVVKVDQRVYESLTRPSSTETRCTIYPACLAQS